MIHVVLTGFMASGKSAVGRRLAARLKRPFLDLDEAIEKAEGRAIADIFAADGEPAFRAIERRAVASLALTEPSVVATGGGTFVDARNRERLSQLGVVVCLIVNFETVLERISRNDKRPLATGADSGTRLRKLWEERMESYKKADVLVETDGLTIEQSAARVAAMVEPRLKIEAETQA